MVTFEKRPKPAGQQPLQAETAKLPADLQDVMASVDRHLPMLSVPTAMMTVVPTRQSGG